MNKFQPVLEQLKLKTKFDLKNALCEDDSDVDIDQESFYSSLSTKLKLSLNQKDSDFLFHQIDPYNKGFIKYKTLETYVEIYEERCFQKEEGPFHTNLSIYSGVRCQDNIFEWTEYAAPPDSGDEIADHYISLSRNGLLTFWRKDLTKHYETTVSVFGEGAKMTAMATGFACIPRYKVIAASTTTSDIRFFCASTYKFKHLFSIVWLPSILLHMHCYNSEMLICGDFLGRTFFIEMEGSFFERLRRKAEHLEPHKIDFDDIVKGCVGGLRCESTAKIHFSNVEKVKYIPTIRAVISCSVNTKRAVLIYYLDRKESLSFTSEGGVSCFDFSEKLNCVVTGGIDNLIKIWNPNENTSCNDTLTGHLSSVTHVLVDDRRVLVVTADRDRTIRCWDLLNPLCLQVLKFKEAGFSGKSPFSTLHLDQEIGKLIITTYQVAVLEARQSYARLQAHPDSEIIILAAYSNVFDCFVTVGNKSSVAVWSPDYCSLIYEFTEAYTATSKDGISKVVDINAAGLDPTKRRLITAGRDRCIKVWNFHLGICLREFHTTFSVLALSFVGFEIFAGGSSRLISIFYDRGEDNVENKIWKTPHERTIISMACYNRTFLASASSDGQIIIWLWKSGDAKLYMKDSNDGGEEEEYDSIYPAKSIVNKRRRCSICQIMFLENRDMDAGVGNLVSCGVDGRIRFWNVLCTNKINRSQLLSKFRAVFRESDGVLCMTTDCNNKILFTGDTMGYIRTYDLEGYYSSYGSIPAEKPKTHHLRSYPFLTLQRLIEKNHTNHSKFGTTGGEVELGYAPLLLNCFRTHTRAIHKIEYSDERSIVATAARPGSIRLWTLAGVYIGFLGSQDTSEIISLDRLRLKGKMPDDIKEVASATTLHVFNSGKKPLWERAMAAVKRCRLGCMPESSKEQPFQWLRENACEATEDSTRSFSLQHELEKRLPHCSETARDNKLQMHSLQIEDMDKKT